MTKTFKYLLYIACSLVLSLFISLNANAQFDDPGCDPLDPACPIDGGVSLLIAAGIGLGAKKALSQHKKDN